MLIACLIFFPMLAAPIVWMIGRKRNEAVEIAASVVTAVELLLAVLLWKYHDPLDLAAVLPGGLHFRADGFRLVYCLLAALLWCFTTLFGRQYFKHEREGIAGYWFFVLITLGATEGLFLSADFLTAFCFFEMLSLSSFPWVAQEREEDAICAAKTYLAVAVIGGLILLMGIWLLRDATGTLFFSELNNAVAGLSRRRAIAAGVCILLGFGAKAGMFPLHIWLPKAHPVAPAPASALLSGMLTKVGVFGILQLTLHALFGDRVFGLILLILAVITMVLGAVLAVFSENLKRTLACSSMSQIGFILTGLAAMILANSYGETHASGLALTGALLHMVNHSLLKLLLFLSAGAVAMNLHKLRLDDIRGWGRNKPLLKICFAAGVIGIGGVPGLNGYLSKTLLHEGLAHLISAGVEGAGLLRIAEILFLFSGGLTFAYMLRLFFCVFVERNTDPAVQASYDREKPYLTPLSAGVLICSAVFLPVMGLPEFALKLGAVMSGEHAVHLEAFAWENLKGALTSLSVGLVVYLGFIRPVLLKKKLNITGKFDLEDQFYRPLLLRWLPAVFSLPARLLGENLLLKRFPMAIPIGLSRLMGENLAIRQISRATVWTGSAISQAMGENTVTRRITKAAVLIGSAIGRVLEGSLDRLTLLLRRTVLREEKRKTEDMVLREPRLKPAYRATVMALSRVTDNFSFAMMMLCIGIILVFALIVLALVSW